MKQLINGQLIGSVVFINRRFPGRLEDSLLNEEFL